MSLQYYLERSIFTCHSLHALQAQSVVLSLSWTLMSFGVYWELMQAILDVEGILLSWNPWFRLLLVTAGHFTVVY